MLKVILDKLKAYPPLDLQPSDSAVREAAVLIALTQEERPHLILTQRALHMTDHAGEVALPGGMWDACDESLLATALREGHEEIGLVPELVEVVAALPAHKTRLGVPVTPFVGLISPALVLVPELSELDAIFRVPVDYLLDLDNLLYRDFRLMGDDYSLPCYHFENFVIWGFTLGVLAEFFNNTLNAGIVLKYPQVPALAEKIARVRRDRENRKG